MTKDAEKKYNDSYKNMKKLSKSTRKYIRNEKARIRKEVVDTIEQDKLIISLTNRFYV